MSEKRIHISREDADLPMELQAAKPPEAIYGGWMSCPHCGTSHINRQPRDPYPQCPYCGQTIDLTRHIEDHDPKPAA